MDFEWDEDKNRQNIRKHGLDFSDAWEVFAGPMLPELDLRINYGEDRWGLIGLLGNRVVVVTFTIRKRETIRIISPAESIKT